MMSEKEYMATLTPFEKMAYAKSLGYKLKPAEFNEVKACCSESKWHQGNGTCLNSDTTIMDALKNRDFVMSIIIERL